MRGAVAILIMGWFAVTATGASAWPGCEEDRFDIDVQADTLTIHHDASVYDCCLDEIEYAVTVFTHSIEIEEIEVVSESCPCLCCYDVSVQIADLAPGNYEVRFSWYDYDTHQIEHWLEEITVLGDGQGGAFVTANRSGCLDPNSAEGLDVITTWGRMKDLYR